MRGIRLFGDLVALGCVLAGCGGGSSKHATKAASTPVATNSSATQSSPPAGSVGALVTVQMTAELGQSSVYRIAIHDLRRHDPFVTLDLAVTCLSSTCGPWSELAKNIPSDPQASHGVASAIALVDPTADKRYEVVRDVQDRAYSSSLSVSGMRAGQTLQVWATYPSPPSSLSSIDVLFGNGGPWVHAVPISEAAAPDPSSWGGSVTPATPAPFAQPPGSTNTSGLSLPVIDVQSAVGNANGSDQQSARRSTLTLRSDMLFRFDKSNPTPRARAILRAVAPRIVRRAAGTVAVDGYTDSIGTDAVNIPLSKARARSVVSFLGPLTARAHVRYNAAGFGSADPIAPNTKADGSGNPAGRALNRRVTISFPVRSLAPPARRPRRPRPPAARRRRLTSSSQSPAKTRSTTTPWPRRRSSAPGTSRCSG